MYVFQCITIPSRPQIMVKLVFGVIGSNGSKFAMSADSEMSMDEFRTQLSAAGHFPQTATLEVTRNGVEVQSLSELVPGIELEIPAHFGTLTISGPGTYNGSVLLHTPEFVGTYSSDDPPKP